MHRLGEREDALIPAVVPKDTRKGPPQTRVRPGVVGQSVGADHGCRMLQDAAHILFRHAVVDRAGRLQAGCGQLLLHAPGMSNLLQGLAGHFRMRRRPGDIDAHAVIHLAKIEGAGRGRIGIAVALHRLPGPGRLQCVQDLCAPAPICDARALQMGNDHRHLALTAGIEGFAHGREDLLAFRTHMRNVNRARGSKRFGQRQDFFAPGPSGPTA